MRKRGITVEDLLRLKFVADPQISPDGSRVVFAVKAVDAEKNRYLSHLWMVEVATGAARQFTCGEVSDSSPRWSPDGKRIAFLRTEDKRTQIWGIPADGGEARQLTQLDEGSIGAPEWSPNRKRIAFTFRPTHS
nr:PD40 domain-containing protein [Ardenticatenia bacterium]